jgi:PIN domain nuclease of toxin-antitoxin system
LTYLLDTHVFLWIVSGGPLSKKATAVILDSSSQLYLSAATYWEICIKASLGKLQLSADWPTQFDDVIAQNSIQWLNLDPRAARRLLSLPFYHRDPFDRMLVAQALEGNHRLISADTTMGSYPIEVVW